MFSYGMFICTNTIPSKCSFLCQISKVDDLYFYKLTSNSPANITRHQVNINGVIINFYYTLKSQMLPDW